MCHMSPARSPMTPRHVSHVPPACPRAKCQLSQKQQEATKSNKKQQEATRSNKKQQEATRSIKKQQEAPRSNKKQQEATRSNKKHQEATRSNKKHQEATRSNKKQQEATRSMLMLGELGETGWGNRGRPPGGTGGSGFHYQPFKKLLRTL